MQVEAILTAARYIMTGEANAVLAGGTESMGERTACNSRNEVGSPLGGTTIEDWVWDGLYDTVGGCAMAETAENLAEKYRITREEVDSHALLSHERVLAAMEKGFLKQEIVPVTVQDRKGSKVIEQDEHVRRTSMEKLGKLKPRFVKNGVVTPGNASGMVDGAAAVIVTSSKFAAEKGLKPIARLVSWGVVGVDPE